MAKLPSLLVIVSFLFQLSPSLSTSAGIRVQLAHVDLQLNLTMAELSLRGVERTKQSISSIASIAGSLMNTLAATDNVLARVHWARFSYQIDIGIGTPAVPITVIADTGSDLIWTQCAPCRCFPQPGPIYAPSNSTSFSKPINCSSPLCQSLGGNERTCDGSDCNYHYAYADSSLTEGFLASETFTFGSTEVPGIAFGCGRTNSLSNTGSSAGIVGLGRGALSLVSQLGAGRFSYCLTKYGESKTSPLLLGSLAVLSGAVRSTPFVRTPSRRLSGLYYLSLRGISVGSRRLSIPSSVFELRADGSGGTVIDSGSTFTVLERRAFGALKQELQSQLGLTVADGSLMHLDLCFSVDRSAETRMPELVFHFDGADMDVPAENYVIPLVEIGMACVAILDSGAGLSILGGFQQQNMHVLYDLEGNSLSFAKARCDQL